MGDIFDIGVYLASQGAEGELDSQGKFTISQEDAVRKRARFTMPFGYAWVLKVVQAAVAWNSAEITVRQYRTFTLFAFCPRVHTVLPSEEELVEGLLSGDTQSLDPIALLCLGLRNMVEQTNLSFRLIIEIPGREKRPIHSGRDAEGLALEERLARVDSGTGLRLMVAHMPLERYLFGRLVPKPLLKERPDLRIAETLQRFCYLCPVKLTLDGKRIDGLLSNPTHGFHFQRRPLALGTAMDFALPTWRLPVDFEEKVISLNTGRQSALRSYGGAKTGTLWFYLTALQPKTTESWDHQLNRASGFETHSIYFVQNGVVVDCHHTRIPTKHLRLSIFVSAEGLPKDLSGFSISRSQELYRRMKTVRRAISAKLRDLQLDPVSFIRDLPKEGSEVVNSHLEMENSLREGVDRVLGLGFPLLNRSVASTLSLGRNLLSFTSDPPEVVGDLANQWWQSLLRDLKSLEKLEEAEFVGTNWLTLS